ncbi:hypothetical protein Hanom_Chr03g00208731 [Helianthus anomalus]
MLSMFLFHPWTTSTLIIDPATYPCTSLTEAPSPSTCSAISSLQTAFFHMRPYRISIFTCILVIFNLFSITDTFLFNLLCY